MYVNGIFFLPDADGLDVVFAYVMLFCFFFQAEDGIRDIGVTGVQTCALPISADVIVVDSIEQSRQEAGDLIIAFKGDEICWTGVKKLSDVVAGKVSGRTSDTEVTLFKSNGIAAWDLAVAMQVYALAREKGLGRLLPFWSE